MTKAPNTQSQIITIANQAIQTNDNIEIRKAINLLMLFRDNVEKACNSATLGASFDLFGALKMLEKRDALNWNNDGFLEV